MEQNRGNRQNKVIQKTQFINPFINNSRKVVGIKKS